MNARIHDYAGRLCIEVRPDTDDERLLLRAFMREHAECTKLFVHCVEDTQNGRSVTFGETTFNQDTGEPT